MYEDTRIESDKPPMAVTNTINVSVILFKKSKAFIYRGIVTSTNLKDNLVPNYEY